MKVLEPIINDIIKNKIIIGHSVDGDIEAIKNDIFITDSYTLRDISVIKDWNG